MDQSVFGLRRQLSLLDATLIGVGSMVGSGIFLDVPGLIATRVHGSMLVLAVWLVAGVVSLAGALCISELSSRMPFAGGQFVYLHEGLGPLSAFLYGWASLLVIQTNSIAAVALAFATYLTPFIPLAGAGLKLAAIGAILALTLANAKSLRLGANTQDVFSIAKGLALAGLVAICLWPKAGGVANLEPRWPEAWNASLVGSFGAALVAAEAAQVAFPRWGRTIFAGTVAVATFGTAAAFILTCPRIYYAMARDGLFFKFLGSVDPHTSTPASAILLQGIIAALLTLTGGYIRLFSNAMFAEFLFYGLSVVALFRLRMRELGSLTPDAWHLARSYPWLPLGFLIFSGWFVINMLSQDFRGTAAVAVLLAAGLPVYWAWKEWQGRAS